MCTVKIQNVEIHHAVKPAELCGIESVTGVQAWKDIENFLHGDRSALHSNRRQHAVLATTTATGAETGGRDQLHATSPEHCEDYGTSDSDSLIDMAAACSANMFPGQWRRSLSK